MKEVIQQVLKNPLTSIKSILLLDLKMEQDILERRVFLFERLSGGFNVYGGMDGSWKIYYDCAEALKPRIEEIKETIKQLETFQ